MSDNQKTFVMVKPDGVRRRLIGEVVRRIEAKGYDVREMKLFTIDERPRRGALRRAPREAFLRRAGVVHHLGTGRRDGRRGPDAVVGMRQIMGATNPLEAATGSIRGDFATLIGENIVHGSDSPESAEREIKLFFG